MSRLGALREAMAARRVPALLVSAAANRRYLSGFRGDDGHLWVTPEDAAIVVDSRFWEQAAQESHGWRVERIGEERLPAVVARLSAGVRAFGVESEHLTYSEVMAIRRAARGVAVRPVTGLVEALRDRKDAAEVTAIRRAAAVVDSAWKTWVPSVRAGAVEADLALRLEVAIRSGGAEGMAFPPIVAGAARGAMPHAMPGRDALQPGDVVVVDVGAVVDGYCSDMTRTIVVPGGRPDPEFERVYATVAAALEAGLAATRAGALCRRVDAAARHLIREAGYGESFGHGLGHSVGLDVHESVRFSPLARPRARVPEGAVVTIEPGVYLPGRFGVRLEQLVHVGEDGCEVLTHSPL